MHDYVTVKCSVNPQILFIMQFCTAVSHRSSGLFSAHSKLIKIMQVSVSYRNNEYMLFCLKIHYQKFHTNHLRKC